MHRIICLASAGLAAIFAAGCQSSATPRIVVPDDTHGNPAVTYHHDAMKPLAQQGSGDAPPFHDAPIVTQQPPEQRDFVEAYNRVGRPRIGVMVSPIVRPGTEDELAARNIDYVAMQTILADWFASGGQVTIISTPAAVPSGQAKPAGDMNVDVIVEARIEPTRQAGGPAGRLVAEAINTQGGQSLGRAVLDIPPPLTKPRLNDCTRFVARKLMDEMTGTWDASPPAQQPPAQSAPPTSASAPISAPTPSPLPATTPAQ